MKCKVCKNVIPEKANYCPICGAENKSSQRCSFIKANKIPVCILAVAILISFFFLGKKIHEDNEFNEWYKEYKRTENYSSSNNSKSSTPYHKYSNSTYKIGVDMPAGEYVLLSTANDNCGYFSVKGDSAGGKILFNSFFENNSIATVENGEYFELSDCYAIPINDVQTLDTSGSGMFLVGKHINSGEYKLFSSSGDGYYCVFSNSRQDKILRNDFLGESAYVTVHNGEYLELSDCRIVK